MEGESVATFYADSRQPSPDRPDEQHEEQETQEDAPDTNGNLPVSWDGKSEQSNEQREKSLADPLDHRQGHGSERFEGVCERRRMP